MKAPVVPRDGTVEENRKTSLGAMALSACLTLVGLSIIAAFSPKGMIIAAGCAFALLLTRFAWLVWREMK